MSVTFTRFIRPSGIGGPCLIQTRNQGKVWWIQSKSGVVFTLGIEMLINQSNLCQQKHEDAFYVANWAQLRTAKNGTPNFHKLISTKGRDGSKRQDFHARQQFCIDEPVWAHKLQKEKLNLTKSVDALRAQICGGYCRKILSETFLSKTLVTPKSWKMSNHANT